MEPINKFPDDHHPEYDDFELFGIDNSLRDVDTSAFEELFRKEKPKVTNKYKEIKTLKPAQLNGSRPDNKHSFRALKVFRSLLTVLFVVYIFKVVIF